MQTELLTSLLTQPATAGSIISSNQAAVPQTEVDFGALLLALLSASSFPVALPVNSGETDIPEITVGNGATAPDVLSLPETVALLNGDADRSYPKIAVGDAESMPSPAPATGFAGAPVLADTAALAQTMLMTTALRPPKSAVPEISPSEPEATVARLMTEFSIDINQTIFPVPARSIDTHVALPSSALQQSVGIPLPAIPTALFALLADVFEESALPSPQTGNGYSSDVNTAIPASDLTGKMSNLMRSSLIPEAALPDVAESALGRQLAPTGSTSRVTLTAPPLVAAASSHASASTVSAKTITAAFPGAAVESLNITPAVPAASNAAMPRSEVPSGQQQLAAESQAAVTSIVTRPADARDKALPRPAPASTSVVSPCREQEGASAPVEPVNIGDKGPAGDILPVRTATNDTPAFPIAQDHAGTPAADTTDAATPDDAPVLRFAVEPQALRPPLRSLAEILLRVQPESLGTVRLQLRTIDNHLAARVVVQSSEAQRAVQGNLPELQRTLADAGLVIDRFDVTVAQTANSGQADPDALAQRRRYAFKPKVNRRYQEAAGLQKSAPVGGLPTTGITGGGVRLNLVA